MFLTDKEIMTCFLENCPVSNECNYFWNENKKKNKKTVNFSRTG
jgi:hypothetical protein